MDILQEVSGLIRAVSDNLIMSRFQSIHDIRNLGIEKNKKEIVTSADIDSERFLTAGLQQIMPSANILSEEIARIQPQIKQMLFDNNAHEIFIVDPLDGSNNYLNGKKEFAVAVSFMKDSEIEAAWIYLPYYKTMLCGDERGVFLNGKKIMLSNSPYIIEKIETNQSFVPFLPDKYTPVCSNSCSYAYYSLISGKTDAVVFKKNLLPWDHTAGTFLYQKAGGYSACVDGRPYSPKNLLYNTLILAQNKQLWNQLFYQLAIPIQAHNKDRIMRSLCNFEKRR